MYGSGVLQTAWPEVWIGIVFLTLSQPWRARHHRPEWLVSSTSVSSQLADELSAAKVHGLLGTVWHSRIQRQAPAAAAAGRRARSHTALPACGWNLPRPPATPQLAHEAPSMWLFGHISPCLDRSGSQKACSESGDARPQRHAAPASTMADLYCRRCQLSC